MQPWLVPVGGFLGAGKTTLILAAARLLTERRLKCAAILNDQAGDLVDSAYVTSRGLTANDVTGGCFCCRFSDLMEKASELRALSPDVIFLEPVGSCTDLSATILQPLKREFAHEYRLTPLTVVIDPARAADLSDPNIAFLFERQCAEADLIVSNKSDLYPASKYRSVSALTGSGVAAWLDEILSGSIPAGAKLLEIDYQQYAAAEAALGWLNWSADITVSPAISPASLIGPLLDLLQTKLTAANAQIVHLKIFDQTPSSYLKAALTTNDGDPSVEGDLTASPESEHSLRFNLRAIIDPKSLASLFSEALHNLPGQRKNELMQCFSPAAPNPEHRYAEIIS
jgi:hypothetical protein